MYEPVASIEVCHLLCAPIYWAEHVNILQIIADTRFARNNTPAQSKGRLWFDKPVLSRAEGLTINDARRAKNCLTSMSLTCAVERPICRPLTMDPLVIPSPLRGRVREEVKLSFPLAPSHREGEILTSWSRCSNLPQVFQQPPRKQRGTRVPLSL